MAIGLRHAGPTAKLKISIPIEIYLEFEKLLFDPRRGKATYGYRSSVVSELIANWNREAQAKRQKLLEDHQAA